jgi:hypothetical protein
MRGAALQTRSSTPCGSAAWATCLCVRVEAGSGHVQARPMRAAGHGERQPPAAAVHTDVLSLPVLTVLQEVVRVSLEDGGEWKEVFTMHCMARDANECASASSACEVGGCIRCTAITFTSRHCSPPRPGECEPLVNCERRPFVCCPAQQNNVNANLDAGCVLDAQQCVG